MTTYSISGNTRFFPVSTLNFQTGWKSDKQPKLTKQQQIAAIRKHICDDAGVPETVRYLTFPQADEASKCSGSYKNFIVKDGGSYYVDPQLWAEALYQQRSAPARKGRR